VLAGSEGLDGRQGGRAGPLPLAERAAGLADRRERPSLLAAGPERLSLLAAGRSRAMAPVVRRRGGADCFARHALTILSRMLR
jgi:hypothetical protein